MKPDRSISVPSIFTRIEIALQSAVVEFSRLMWCSPNLECENPLGLRFAANFSYDDSTSARESSRTIWFGKTTKAGSLKNDADTAESRPKAS